MQVDFYFLKYSTKSIANGFFNDWENQLLHCGVMEFFDRVSNTEISCLIRYCVDSTAMKIHISQSTKDLLDLEGGYEIQLRGSMEVKVIVKFQQKQISPFSLYFFGSYFSSSCIRIRPNLTCHNHNGFGIPEHNPDSCMIMDRVCFVLVVTTERSQLILVGIEEWSNLLFVIPIVFFSFLREKEKWKLIG